MNHGLGWLIVNGSQFLTIDAQLGAINSQPGPINSQLEVVNQRTDPLLLSRTIVNH